MLIKFSSEESADFVMLHSTADQLLTMMGYGGRTEGSVSGDALVRALERLDTTIAREQDNPGSGKAGNQEGANDGDEDDDNDEQEAVSLSARAVPLVAMLRRANDAGGYVMWRED